MIKNTKKYITFLLFSFQCVSATNIMTLLQDRETHGRISKRKFKNCIAATQYPEAVNALRQIDDFSEFILSIPKKYIPNEDASFEDNILMDIIPAALADASQEFKDDILADNFMTGGNGIERLRCVALVEAGANPNILSSEHINSEEYPIGRIGSYRHKDYDYVSALLARGANPNIFISYRDFVPGIASEKHTPLVKVYGLELAKLMVEYGADPKTVGSASKKTCLHVAAVHEEFPADLLEFYIKHGVDVNAKDLGGVTPLESIILNEQRHAHESEHQKLKNKVILLLDKGADFRRALYFIANIRRSCTWDVDDKYRILHMQLRGHEAYMEETARLRNILLH